MKSTISNVTNDIVGLIILVADRHSGRDSEGCVAASVWLTNFMVVLTEATESTTLRVSITVLKNRFCLFIVIVEKHVDLLPAQIKQH